MRYFFISYAHSLGFGSLTLQLDEFPNEVAIIKTITDEDPNIESITILTLFEFKTKEDFEAYNRID
jgi:hypothetical protein